MKSAKHITRKLEKHSGNILLTTYPNVRKSTMKKMINRLWLKSGKALLLKSPTSIMIPSLGIELIRTGYRKAILCQLTDSKLYRPDLTLEEAQNSSCTHFYNEMFDTWVSIDEALEEKV